MTSELKSMLGENYADQAPIPQINYQKELEKKRRDYIKKQNGLKREVYKLVGGAPSIVERVSIKGQKKSNWVWAKFTNPARTDSLKLEHWQRKEDVNKDYDSAKMNTTVEIVEFTKDEYDKLIKPNDRNWNYEQTMYLWDLIKQYELRFIVIMDRFDEEKYGQRTIESLKDRYYSVARIILEHRRLYDHPIIKSGYNYEQEIKRRTYLEKTMNKSFAELKEESHIMELAENLNKKMEKNENFEKSLRQKLDELPAVNNNINMPNSMNIDEGENSINTFSENKNINSTNIATDISKMNLEPFAEEKGGQTFEDFLKNNITSNDSFVYLRSQKLKHNLPVSEKIQERVDNYMKEFNIPQKLIPTARVEMAYDNLRNNIILYTSLKKFLDKKEKELAFLQKKYQEIPGNKNPQLLQNINVVSTHPQPSRTDKSLPQIKTIRPPPPPEIKKQEIPPPEPQNKNVQNNNINIPAPNIPPTNNIININNQPQVDLSNNNNNVNNANAGNINPNNETQDKQSGHKRKRNMGTPKPRKRKNMNEDDAHDEEKEPKSNSKKKKRGNK